LHSGETAVVTKVYAPDPHRPRVKVVLIAQRVDFPYEVNRGSRTRGPERDRRAADAASVGIDALALFDRGGGATGCPGPRFRANPAAPRLVVLIVVDQMRATTSNGSRRLDAGQHHH
jgi:hypothetical protein